MTSTADLVGTIMQHVYEPLYTFDANWGIAPMLAESLPVVSKDGLTYSITLRKGVMLHNGRWTATSSDCRTPISPPKRPTSWSLP